MKRQYYIVVFLVVFMVACSFLTSPSTSISTVTPTPRPQQTSTQSINKSEVSQEITIQTPFEFYASVNWTTTFADIVPIQSKVAHSNNGNVFVLSNYEGGLILIKTNGNGEKEWDVNFDKASFSSFSEYSFSIVLDPEENAYISGQSKESWGNPINSFKAITFGFDTFIAKINSDGQIIWTTFLNAAPCSNLTVSENNNILIAAGHDLAQLSTFNGNNYASGEFALIKVNNDGQIEWTKEYFGTEMNTPPSPYGLIIGSDRSIFATNDTDRHYADFVSELKLLKFQSDGTFLWEITIGNADTTSQNTLESLVLDSNNNLYIVGVSKASWGNPIAPFDADNLGDVYDTFLAKYDLDGNLLWNTFLESDFYYEAISVDKATGYLYITGNYNPAYPVNGGVIYSAKHEGVPILKVDPNGSIISKILLDKSNITYVSSMFFINDEEVYVTGSDENGTLVIANVSLIPEKERKYREAGPYTAELSTHIPAVDEISTDPKVVFTNLIIAFSFAVFALPFSLSLDAFLSLVNKIAEGMSKKIKNIKIFKQLTNNIHGLKNGTQSSTFDILKTFFEVFKLLIVISFYGFVFSLLDSEWEPFSIKGIILFIEMSIAYGLVGIFDDIIQWIYIRKWGENGQFSVHPTNFILIIASVAISRFIPLTPGLMFGSPEALKYNNKDISNKRNEFLVKVSLICYIIIGLLAWLPTIILNFILNQKIQVLNQDMMDVIGGLLGFMLIIFAVCLENLFIQLVGITGGIGKKIREKNWAIWLTIWIPTAFLFLHTLLNPQNDFFEEFNAQSTLLTVTCMVFFVFGVVGYALYKSFISSKKGKK